MVIGAIYYFTNNADYSMPCMSPMPLGMSFNNSVVLLFTLGLLSAGYILMPITKGDSKNG